MRCIPALVVAFVIVAGLLFGCIPRHPPHTASARARNPHPTAKPS
jgi:hypothetical protein